MDEKSCPGRQGIIASLEFGLLSQPRGLQDWEEQISKGTLSPVTDESIPWQGFMKGHHKAQR